MKESEKLAHLVAGWGPKDNHITAKLAKAEQMVRDMAGAEEPPLGPGIFCCQQSSSGS